MLSNTQMSRQNETKSGRTYGGLTQEQRKAARYKQFLEAGLEVFGTSGFRSATVRQLCRQAKLTDRYFYETFGSLELLLIAIYKCQMDILQERVITAITEVLPSQDIQHIADVGLTTFFTGLEDPRIAQVCMVELEGVSVDVNDLYHSYINSFADTFSSMAGLFYPAWQIADDEWKILGISLVGAMRQAATYWLLSNYAMDKKALVTATAKIFLGLIAHLDKEQATNSAPISTHIPSPTSSTP